MKKILWLASWYPSNVDPYTRDFIERHARAASLESQIKVLHVVKDKNRLFPDNLSEECRRYAEGGEATIIYYHSPDYRIFFFEKLLSNLLYIRIHFHFLRKYIREKGKPDGLHVHTGMKAGMAALLIKFRYRIPYVVSEHWAGLCPEAKPNFNDRSYFLRWLWKKVLKNAAGNSVVSENLATAMQDRFSLKKVNVIPNVVDSNIFYPSVKPTKNSRFIHISAIKNYQKNVHGLLDAAAILVNRLPEFG